MTLHRFNPLKILVHADRLQAVADGEWPFPLDWHIYPSNKCNHRCDWCMFRQNGEQADHPVKLSLATLCRAIDDAAETSAKLVHFSGGGEPLLNQHAYTAMRRAQLAGLAVALTTNGRWLTPEIAHEVDFLRVSLNAGTKQQHDKTCYGGSGSDWQKIIDAVGRSIPHRKRDVGLAFVVDANNWRDIMAFCEVASDLKVDFVHIRPAYWFDKAKDGEVRAIMPMALALCHKARERFGGTLNIYAITEKFEGHWSPRAYGQCLATKTGICLTASGEFAVCQDRTDLRFGSHYTRGKPFREIWGGLEHRQVVASLVDGEELDRCPRCVWNKRNEIIEYVFKHDVMRLEMV